MQQAVSGSSRARVVAAIDGEAAAAVAVADRWATAEAAEAVGAGRRSVATGGSLFGSVFCGARRLRC